MDVCFVLFCFVLLAFFDVGAVLVVCTVCTEFVRTIYYVMYCTVLYSIVHTDR